ncbi:MAG TPA: hypothetical protein VF865_13155 [Acidobacteriaceae bacterium]
MNSKRRPVAVLILAWLYVTVGSVVLVYNLPRLRRPDGVWIELTELLAILCGAFIDQVQTPAGY